MFIQDTHPSVERKQIELLRHAGARWRLVMGMRMGEDAIQLSRRELRRLHPKLNDQQIALLWVRVHYGEDIASRLQQHLSTTS